jgi:hypothetical protein
MTLLLADQRFLPAFPRIARTAIDENEKIQSIAIAGKFRYRATSHIEFGTRKKGAVLSRSRDMASSVRQSSAR